MEGTFRRGCEATLTALRDGAESVMLLLEAIVTDRLVDWTSHREDSASRKVERLHILSFDILTKLRRCSSYIADTWQKGVIYRVWNNYFLL